MWTCGGGTRPKLKGFRAIDGGYSCGKKGGLTQASRKGRMTIQLTEGGRRHEKATVKVVVNRGGGVTHTHTPAQAFFNIQYVHLSI
jgi:hypothetical protein